jgi:hypothetical protein
MPDNRFYAVDRIESQRALLEDDDGTTHIVDTRRLPRGTREGTVLRVELDDAGNPDWNTAVIDDAEAARRRAEARDRLERLKKRDPGGDITL